MLKYASTVVLALLLGTSAVTSAVVEPTSHGGAAAQGADSQDVMPAVGGGIEVHACRGVSEDGPYTIVAFGPDAGMDAGGVQLLVDAAPAGACSHLVVFTQPEATQAL